MREERETLIRVARIPADAPPSPVYAGDPPVPIPARWVVVSICRAASEGPPTYCVYLLGGSGAILDVGVYESIRIALDQAQALVGATRLEWLAGKLEVGEDGRLDPSEFGGYFAG